MQERMKILIAYDGSECAEAALDDLRRAGLPRRINATVLSVLDYWMPLPASIGMVDTDFSQQLLKEEQEIMKQAQRATGRLQKLFPEWEVSAETGLGVPGSVVVEKADLWKPDLIIAGSHGRSVFGRFFLGSVSQRIVNESHCSVRVARGRVQEPDAPARIIVGVDGSKGAEAAVKAVAARHWPKDSEVRVVNAAWTLPPVTSDQVIGQVTTWITREQARVRELTDAAQRRLRAAGLKTSCLVREEEPKHLLIHEAERWSADCIFVGARGMGRLERFLIGSVSSAVAARAHCSVEIVRAT